MDSENEGYEDLGDEEASMVKAPSNPTKKTSKSAKAQEESSEIVTPEARYIAYKSPAVEGVIDTETNIPVGTETNVILAEILNKLDSIEKSTG